MNRIRKGVLAIALMMGLIGWSGPGWTADPGVTDTEIVLGAWFPLTGFLSFTGTSERDAIRVWVNEVNAKGGIHGRKIRFIAYDDGASPQEALTAARRLINQDKVFALMAGSISGATLPVVPVINRAKIPFVSSMAAHRKLLQPFSHYIFRIYANEIDQSNAFADYAIGVAKLKRPAIIYNSTDFGIGGFELTKARLKKKWGMKFVAAERYNPGDQDFSAQLLRIKQGKPDGILVHSFSQDGGIIVRQAKELGLNVPYIGGSATTTPLFPRAAGAAGVGFVGVFVYPHIMASNDAVVVSYKKKVAKLHPKGMPVGRPSEYDFAGYTAALVVGEALKRAGRNLTREKFIQALETFRNFETGVMWPISFNKDDHEGTSQVRMIRVNEKRRWEELK